MDFMKTLLVYMMILAVGASPALPVSPAPAPTAEAVSAPAETPVPPPTEAPETVYETLSPGDRGEAVVKLQQRLADLGYLQDTVDGAYGQNTRKAVEDFQASSGLSVDGIAGPATQKALFEQETTPAASEAPGASETPAAETPTPTEVPAPTESAVPTESPAPTEKPALTESPAPTEKPAPTESPALPETPAPTAIPAALVQIRYVDEKTGDTLYQTEMMLRDPAVVYADNARVGDEYLLVSPGAVPVDVQAGKAAPDTVLFTYQQAEPTPEPTREPTQAPSPAPTDVPTPAPTETPAPTTALPAEPRPAGLVPDVLMPEGSQVTLEETLYPIPWYIDSSETVYLCLDDLKAICGWTVQDGRCVINGNEVSWVTEGNELISLTVNDSSFADHALMGEGWLFADADFFNALGYDVTIADGMLCLSVPNE